MYYYIAYTGSNQESLVKTTKTGGIGTGGILALSVKLQSRPTKDILDAS